MSSIFKSYKAGMHRTVSPSETVRQAMPVLSQMGITRIANVTGLDRLAIPVFNAYRPNSKSLSVAQGKGLTPMAAKASAMMEAIEIFHAEEIDLPLLTGSHDELESRVDLIDVAGLALLTGQRFDPARSFPWIEGRNLINDEPIWLPFELVHTDYTVPRRRDAGCFVASTNGLASGNHILEAIVHGIYEVIERDAHTLWHIAPNTYKAATRIDLSTIASEMNLEVIGRMRSAGMKLAAWDMTSDLGVPAIYCLIIDEQTGGHSGAGAGTHLNRDLALLRAVTEAAQVRTNYITGARDDLGLDEYDRAGIQTKVRQARILMDLESDPLRSFSDIASMDLETFDEDLRLLLDRLRLVGIEEVISVDLTKSEFSIPVVRMVIPGLEGPHDHDAYWPGRRARGFLERGHP